MKASGLVVPSSERPFTLRPTRLHKFAYQSAPKHSDIFSVRPRSFSSSLDCRSDGESDIFRKSSASSHFSGRPLSSQGVMEGGRIHAGHSFSYDYQLHQNTVLVSRSWSNLLLKDEGLEISTERRNDIPHCAVLLSAIRQEVIDVSEAADVEVQIEDYGPLVRLSDGSAFRPVRFLLTPSANSLIHTGEMRTMNVHCYRNALIHLTVLFCTGWTEFRCREALRGLHWRNA